MRFVPNAVLVGYLFLSLSSSMPAQGQLLDLNNAAGAAGDSVWFSATLLRENHAISAFQVDLFWADETPIGECTVNDDELTGVPGKFLNSSFLPNGCSGAQCIGIRLAVWSTSDLSVMRDQIVPFLCRVDISAQAPAGDYIIAGSNAMISDPAGNPDTLGVAIGQVTVSSAPGCP